MWILPTNHPLYSVFAQASADSKEDLNELSAMYEHSAMWRSKPSSAKTWLARWKRVFWIQRLFGRTLKPFQQKYFETKLRASLADTPAPLFPWPDNDSGKWMKDTFGRLYETMSTQLDLFGASSKMSMTTSPWDSTLFTKTYELWVTGLRLEYTRRQSVARHTNGKESSSSLFTTPVASDLHRNTAYKQGGTPLSLQAQWPTPRTSDVEGGQIETNFSNGSFRSMRKTSNQEFGAKLRDAVESFPTPSSRDHKGSTKHKRDHSPMLDQFVEQRWPTPTFAGNNQGSLQEWGGSKNWMRGQPHQDPSTNGSLQGLSRGRLNASWVAVLMGTRLEKIFYVRSVTLL